MKPLIAALLLASLLTPTLGQAADAPKTPAKPAAKAKSSASPCADDRRRVPARRHVRAAARVAAEPDLERGAGAGVDSAPRVCEFLLLDY